MVPLRVHLEPGRKMASSKQQGSSLSRNSRSISTNKKTPNLTILKDSRGLDYSWRILPWENNTPPPKHFVLGWMRKIRAYKEKWHVVLLSIHSEEINWIPSRCHDNHIKSMPVHIIPQPLHSSTSLRLSTKYLNRHSRRTLFPPWPKKRITLCHSRVQTHSGANKPGEEWLHHRTTSKIFNRSTQTWHRILRFSILQ